MNPLKPEDFELTLAQQFELRRQTDVAKNLSKDQLAELLLGCTRLLMIKENLIRSIVKKQLGETMLRTIAHPITEE